MAAREQNFDISSLPIEAWHIVTSYLGFTSLISLIKASNKAMYRHLLKNRGFLSVDFQDPDETGESWYHHVCPPISPLLVDGPIWMEPLSSLPPSSFFSGLRSLSMPADMSYYFSIPIGLHHLPRALVNLVWYNCCDVALPSCTISSENGSQDVHFEMKDWLPDLVSLDITNIEPVSSLDKIASQLPRNLTAFRLVTVDAPKVLETARELPLELVSLALHGTQTYNIIHMSTLAYYLKDLPVHLTYLSLSNHLLDHSLDLPHLLTLNLAEVPLQYRQYLPKSLTELRLRHDPEIYDESNAASAGLEQLKKLLTLDVQTGHSLLLPCTPSMTRLAWSAVFPFYDDNFHGYLPRPAATGLPENPFLAFSSSLKTFKQRLHPIPESTLRLIPHTVTHLEADMIYLDGSSLPDGLTRLDKKQDLVDAFWKFPRPFSIHVQPNGLHALFDVLPRPPNCFRHIPTESLTSLTIPHHGISNLQMLPRATLTHLAHIYLTNHQIPDLPPSVTMLHFIQVNAEAPIDFTILRRHLPRLTHLASSAPHHTTYRPGIITLSPEDMPSDAHEMLQEGETEPLLLTLPSPSKKYSSMPTLVMPDDAIRALKKGRASGIVFDGVQFDCSMVISRTRRLKTRDASFTGPFSIPRVLQLNGFAPGLITLDMSNARLTIIDGNKDQVLPKLPTTLKRLRLGLQLAEGVLMSTPLDPSASFPQSLRRLDLIFLRAPTGAWNLSKNLPASLARFEVRHPAGTGEMIQEQVDTLLTRFAAFDVITEGGDVVVVAAKESRTCSVM